MIFLIQQRMFFVFNWCSVNFWKMALHATTIIERTYQRISNYSGGKIKPGFDDWSLWPKIFLFKWKTKMRRENSQAAVQHRDHSHYVTRCLIDGQDLEASIKGNFIWAEREIIKTERKVLQESQWLFASIRGARSESRPSCAPKSKLWSRGAAGGNI